MAFADFSSLISDDQLSALAELNAEKAAAGEPMVTLLDVLADDSVLDGTGISVLESTAAADIPPQSQPQASTVGENPPPPVETVNVLETKIGGAFTGESAGTLDLSKLPDYGEGSSPVLAPDGKGVIRGGVYTSLEPGATNMSGSERNELRGKAAANTKLLLAQQELEVNGTAIADTLGLKQPGDKNFDGEDRERIQQAENAAEKLQFEHTNNDQYKYEQKRNEGPAPVPTGGIGSIQQDANGNWFAVKQSDGSNALGRRLQH
jgi:hypothetical protein